MSQTMTMLLEQLISCCSDYKQGSTNKVFYVRALPGFHLKNVGLFCFVWMENPHNVLQKHLFGSMHRPHPTREDETVVVQYHGAFLAAKSMRN